MLDVDDDAFVVAKNEGCTVRQQLYSVIHKEFRR